MWFCAVRSADLADPGQFRTVQVGRESVLVVRGRDGELRAFLNVCSHRGAQLCTEQTGRSAAPSSARTTPGPTALDGKLVAAPNIATLTDDAGDGIDRYRVRADAGARCANGSATPGCAWPTNRPRSRRRRRRGHRAARRRRRPSTATASTVCRSAAAIVYDVKANWKLIVENFMECYHCATIHPELTEVLPEFADGLAAQYFVGHGAEFGSTRSQGFTVDGCAGFDTLPGITAEQDRRYYAITVKPTVFINLVPDHIIFHRMYPLAADRTVVECDWLYAPDVVASAGATCRGRWSCSTGSTSRTSTPASERSRRCRPGRTATAVSSFPPNTTSRSSTSG